MLQCAGRVVGHRGLGRLQLALQLFHQFRQHGGQQLAQVPGQRADACGLVGVLRLVAQQMAVVFHGGAATRGIHHNGFDFAVFYQRPPGVDIGAHLGLAAFLVVEVKLHRAAATCIACNHGLHAHGIQHAGSGVVDAGHHGGLHAACQQQHLARMFARGPEASILRSRNLLGQ